MVDVVTQQQPSFANLLFTENIAFEVVTSSLLVCANTCFRSNGYYAFSLVKSVSSASLCRGYAAMVTSHTGATSSPGSRTYIIQRRTSAWLDKACTTDAECPTEMSAQCYAERCRCTSGYYYSHTADICTAECASGDLQPSFMLYPNSYLKDNNLYAPCAKDLSVEECQALCVQEPMCRTVENDIIKADGSRMCCMHKVTALDKPHMWKDDEEKDFFQRTCV